MITDLFPLAVLVVVSVLISPALVGLIGVLKDAGLPPRWSPLIAVILGIALMLAYATWGDNRHFLFGLLGVLIGLAACGRYDLSKLTSPPPATITVDDSWLVDVDDPDATGDDPYFASEATLREIDRQREE
jgi:ABC-type uncharacterized transport system permease subunit